MSDNKQQPTARKEEHLSYDILNPTRARRVIYDGIEGSQKTITVNAGATVANVRLHADVVKELNDRNKLHPGSELKTRLRAPEKAEA